MTTNKIDRFGALALFIVALAASLLLTPGVAHAYEVYVTISGAGRVTETTPADLLGPNCASPATTPTGSERKYCFAGQIDGPYRWGWVVRYEATPAPGYVFQRWENSSGGNWWDLDPIICDGSGGSSTYTGSACQFATFQNLQTRAVFADVQRPATPVITNRVISNGGDARFFFRHPDYQLPQSGDPTFKQFECAVGFAPGGNFDDHFLRDWQACGSRPFAYGRDESYFDVLPSEEGTYLFMVRSRDISGNISEGIATELWTVDRAPTVVSNGVTPTQGQTRVQRNTDVSAKFSEPMSADSLMDPSTKTSNTFKIQQWNKKRKSWKMLPATVSLSSDGKTATLDPYGDTATLLAPNKKHRVTIASQITDLTGNPLSQDFVWTFTTGAT